MSFDDDHFSPEVLDEILQLPPEVANLRFNYPYAIALLSEYRDADKYLENYVPTTIEVYYKDTDGGDPYIVLENGKIDYVDFSQVPDLSQSQSIVMICCDDTLAYLQIEDKVIFSCLYEHQLPEIVALPGAELAMAIANFLALQKGTAV